MRSPCSLLVVLLACGDDRRACETTFPTYDTFGEAFVISWCRGCHSIESTARHMAPVGVDFDSLDEMRARADKIRMRAGTTLGMPPAGGPSADERALLVEWIDCGMPE